MRCAPAVPVAFAAAVLLAGLSGGCGEKIAIPEPEGLYSLNAYYLQQSYDDPNAVQITSASGALFVVGSDGTLYKRSMNYTATDSVTGLDDPTAVCVDDDDGLVFVWEAGASRLSTFDFSDLTPLYATELASVRSGTHMVTCRTGVEEIDASIHTFVYVTDPDSGVVHRLAYYDADGTVVPTGILCRSGGLSVRFVNEPRGMARDLDGMLWVCDADTSRNWVIRFDPTPDLTDVVSGTGGSNPLRGLATLVSTATCEPPAAADYVLGDAPECGESWVGGVSDAEAEFNAPQGVAVDGAGRAYVVDHGNDRVQILSGTGIFDVSFNDADAPAPLSIGVYDKVSGTSDVYYGAYVFVVTAETGQVHRFISHEYHTASTTDPWPED